MSFVSLTRLRIRSARFVPAFVVQTYRSLRQLRSAPGFQTGALLADRKWTFWTLTAWDSQEAMRQYMISGAHKKAMPFLMDWCDEASVAHWEQEGAELPTWIEAHQRLCGTGRASKVRNPSANHERLTYRTPRRVISGPIRRA